MADAGGAPARGPLSTTPDEVGPLAAPAVRLSRAVPSQGGLRPRNEDERPRRGARGEEIPSDGRRVASGNAQKTVRRCAFLSVIPTDREQSITLNVSWRCSV